MCAFFVELLDFCDCIYINLSFLCLKNNFDDVVVNPKTSLAYFRLKIWDVFNGNNLLYLSLSPVYLVLSTYS